MKNNIYKEKKVKKDLNKYKSLSDKKQKFEYFTVYEKDGIKFLYSVLPDPTAAPRFSHSKNAIYVTLGMSYYGYIPIAITVYENNLDSYTIHYSHCPFDKTKCHEHTSTVSGHKRIEYKNMSKEHIKLFKKIDQIGESIQGHKIEALLNKKFKKMKRFVYKTNAAKMKILNKYYFNSKIHGTYTGEDFLNHKHVVDGDEKKKKYLYGGEHSTKKVYFRTLKQALTHIRGDDLYDKYDNGLNCLKKCKNCQFKSIQ